MKHFLQSALIAAILPALLGAAPSTPSLNVVNVMPAFWRAVDTTKDRPIADRVAAYKSLVVAPNTAVYDFDEFSRNRSDESIAAYLRNLEPHLPRMRALSDELEQNLAAYETSFVRQMPGFDAGRIVIYFMPSFLHFEGQTHDLGTKTGVLFGLDRMALDPDSNPGVVVAHELYHIYQFEMHPGASTSDVTLWEAVWGEGSAAYASQILTPGATKTEALGRKLADASTDNIRALSCAIQSKWDSRDGNDFNEYFDASQSPKGLPPMGGYLVGYLVAQDLGKTRTVADLAKMQVTELEPLMRSRVAALCSVGSI